MTVLVCGGRTYANWKRLYYVLNSLSLDDLHIISGGAKGADTFAKWWALEAGVRFTEYPADWEKHGKAAGPVRNQRMLDEGKPDLVIAFPGANGTRDMIRRALAAGVKVQIED